MQRPTVISFHGLPSSATMEAAIRRRVDRLEQRYPHLIGCRVVVEAPHQRHRSGTLYRLRIDLAVPGEDIAINRDPGLDHAHEDPLVAVRDAFDIAERQLDRLAETERGEVKTHATVPIGRVVELSPGGEFGFLEATDGGLVRFRHNAVLDGRFDALRVGSLVEYVVMPGDEGDEGPQANTVRLVQPEGLEPPSS